MILNLSMKVLCLHEQTKIQKATKNNFAKKDLKLMYKFLIFREITVNLRNDQNFISAESFHNWHT